MGILERLIEKANAPLTLEANYLYLKRPSEIEDPAPVTAILGLHPDRIPDVAREVLAVLEDYGSKLDTGAKWRDFKWRLLAFVSLVDAFDAPLLEAGDPSSPFRLWYFYFESKFLLIEALLAGLTGFHGATSALLRPILEFTLTQTYFRRMVEQQQSYSPLEVYFRERRLPSWHRLAKDALPPTELGTTVRYRAQNHLKALSASASHAYAPPFSPKELGTLRPEQTLEGLWGWYSLSMVLNAALWVYYANLPALFCPCDLMRRFGCNPPIGLVVDEQLATIVRRTLSNDDHARFAEHASGYASDIRAFCEARPVLTDEAILASWDSEKSPRPSTAQDAFIQTMAALRAMKELLTWKQAEDQEDPNVDGTYATDSLSWWEAVQHRPPLR